MNHADNRKHFTGSVRHMKHKRSISEFQTRLMLYRQPAEVKCHQTQAMLDWMPNFMDFVWLLIFFYKRVENKQPARDSQTAWYHCTVARELNDLAQHALHTNTPICWNLAQSTVFSVRKWARIMRYRMGWVKNHHYIVLLFIWLRNWDIFRRNLT